MKLAAHHLAGSPRQSMLTIEAGHADAEDRLLGLFASVFIRWGARVVVGVGEANAIEMTGSDGAPPLATVRVEGLGNLVHELVHALHAGRLADDHGIDYGQIPFDLTTRAGRTTLWEELSCCVLSCAYLRDASQVPAWFVEQLEIQPVFFGFEHAEAMFWRRLDALLQHHGVEADAIVGEAYVRVETALRRVGGPARWARPRRRPKIAALWAGARSQLEGR